jgi:UDP-2,3-diacylglucosamine hydrolase
MKKNKIYFISDAHLGLPPEEKSRERERLLVEWLNKIQEDAHAVYLMGDIFDYWFEYRKVVPRGFVRFLGKLAELTDNGVEVNYFTGNHDVWIFDYLPKETGIKVFRKPHTQEFEGKKFFLAHGDGLGPGEKSYKLLKKIFTSSFMQWLFARLHPNFATSFAHHWSKLSRLSKGAYTPYLGEEKEDLILYSKKILEDEHFDYFVYGHRHIPLDHKLNSNARVIYLGDWFVNFTYAVFDGNDLKLMYYLKDNPH